MLPRGILLEDGVRAAPDRMGWISGAITWVLGLLSQELASVWEIHARRSTSVEKLFAEQAHGRAGLTRASGYWAGFLGIVGLALPSTLMTSCGL